MLEGKQILITGSSGFLGRHVVEQLQRRNSVNLCSPSRSVCDLRQQADVRQLFASQKPQIVIHTAATVGGIQFNREHPADCSFDNLQMGLNIIHESHLARVEKLILIGSTCSYPNHTATPFLEEALWNGRPESSNSAYGLAKRALIDVAIAYHRQHGLQVVPLVLANLYGPGDCFHLQNGHVIPSLIRKLEENPRSVRVWGTGKAAREFLHVRDAARAVVMSTLWDCPVFPINVGTGCEIRINGLVDLLVRLTGYKGKIRYDDSMPDGQTERRLNVEAAKHHGFEAIINLEDGLKETIEWYRRLVR